ncbi:PIN domain-containing protein [Variovorax terrae]|uniref:PIN domain-containing protein n=1 Tax=Variovorax terrae TaxID=2923278 RepID=A0A9X1VVS9_9BURK|nr:PIN domain-containing protein [Variovorax terrae]MCJ0764158.1 PIN domain-containing protein [Variovorax terrae]
MDANVLYPALMCDVLLSLAHVDLYYARWSPHIEEEVRRNLVKNYPGTDAAVDRRLTLARNAIPDCLVTGYEPLIDTLKLPDVDDRHVLAAAIVGHADAIVTSNVKHFPSEALAPYNIEIQTPDEFIVNQLDLRKVTALTAIKNMRERWERPEITAEQLLQLLADRGMPLTAAHLADAVGLI